MNFFESDLEDIIFNADRDFLYQRGLCIEGKLMRQVKIGNYGIADLISFEKGFLTPGGRGLYHSPHQVTIYELKNKEINYDTFHQIIRYARGIERYLSERNQDFEIRLVMIGRYMDKRSGFSYLSSVFRDIDIYTYDYKEDGIYFHEQSGYKLVEEGFKFKQVLTHE